MWTQALGHEGSLSVVHGLSRSTACGIFLDQDQTSVLSLDRADSLFVFD